MVVQKLTNTTNRSTVGRGINNPVGVTTLRPPSAALEEFWLLCSVWGFDLKLGLQILHHRLIAVHVAHQHRASLPRMHA